MSATSQLRCPQTGVDALHTGCVPTGHSYTTPVCIGGRATEFRTAVDRADGKAGLFDLEEFNQRLDAVFSATTQSQLSTLICVLPPGRPRLLRHPSGPSRICRRPTSADACERLR